NSDIDKNGEATLSNLAPGDAVKFSVRPGTTTIGVLHAGNEALDQPQGGPGGHGHDGPPPGAPATGSGPTGTTQSSTGA
ncbi:MAG TPA: hypothetical protein VFH45_01255, partial [Acidimicrobiales bacterium]|nr:hypothetical protein [Acidimicrobiales bacterium]